MFKKTNSNTNNLPADSASVERVTSVLGPGINWKGNLQGIPGVRIGIRIEGTYEGSSLIINGMIVVGESGKVYCQNIRADNVVVGGTVWGNITARKLEILSTGRVTGNVVAEKEGFSTQEGAFLQGQILIQDQVMIFPQMGVNRYPPGMPGR